MNTVFDYINSSGTWFVDFAAPMLLQSSVLVMILLLVDLLLRKKARAVFRYCMWMLILVKLVLPSSLSSPVGIGNWLDYGLTTIPVAKSPVADNHFVNENLPFVPTAEAAQNVSVVKPAFDVSPVRSDTASPPPAKIAAALTWQGGVFLFWLVVAAAMGLLLLQRAVFVCGLIRQAKEANNLMNDTLRFCCSQMGIKRNVGLKVSANATSPAVCGLFGPVILIPENLGSDFGVAGLRAVVLHELAHIKRFDLWVNLLQTILQIVYFYNPFIWLANWIIRRVREQAVDEMVLVTMGEKAQQYPETLINVARLAFKRPALSLRLIGVVESKSALAQRITHILNRPIPKSAKLGILGLAVILIFAAVLLPMAQAAPPPEFVIKGTVTDAQTGKPIAGAKVGDEKYSGDTQFTHTDANGNYSYKTWSEEHTIFVQADGYQKQIKGFHTRLFPLDLFEKEKVIDFRVTSQNTADSMEFKATLPNGVSVELVGICDYPEDKPRCWGPDGTESKEKLYVKRERDYSNEKLGFIIKVDGPEDLSFAWNEIKSSQGYWGSCTVLDESGNEVKGYKAAVTRNLNADATDIRVGVATEPWQTIVTHNGRGMTTTGSNNILFSQAYESDNFVAITASSPWRKDQVERIIAVDKNGQPHVSKNIGSIASGEIDQITAKFYDLKLSDIVEFQFQTRPYEWVTFKNVSLKPNFKTDVQIRTGEQLSPSTSLRTGSGAGEKAVTKVSGIDIAPADFDIRSDEKRGVCNLVVSIHNESNAAIPKFKLKFYRGDPNKNLDEAGNIQSGWHEAGPIEPGKSWNECTGDFHLPDGQYEFNVMLNYDNSIPEVDHGNNRAVLKIKVLDGKIVDKSVQFKKVSVNPELNSSIITASALPDSNNGNPDANSVGKRQPLPSISYIWGETADGLRAAVEFLPEKEEYAIGEQIGIRFYIQNDSNRIIQFTTGSWRDDGTTCVAQDSKGNKILSRSILYTGLGTIQRKILLPGQIVTLESATLYLAADEKRANSATHPVGNVLILKPGQYSLWYQLDFPDVRSSDSKGKVDVPQLGDWQGLLNTGKRRFIVANQNTLKTPPETKTD